MTQHFNRKQQTFFGEDDCVTCIEFRRGAKRGMAVRAYWLMTNHLHLIAVSETQKSLQVGEFSGFAGCPLRIRAAEKSTSAKPKEE